MGIYFYGINYQAQMLSCIAFFVVCPNFHFDSKVLYWIYFVFFLVVVFKSFYVKFSIIVYNFGVLYISFCICFSIHSNMKQVIYWNCWILLHRIVTYRPHMVNYSLLLGNNVWRYRMKFDFVFWVYICQS